MQAIRSDNPIIFFEHVLLYNLKAEVGTAGLHKLHELHGLHLLHVFLHGMHRDAAALCNIVSPLLCMRPCRLEIRMRCSALRRPRWFAPALTCLSSPTAACVTW